MINDASTPLETTPDAYEHITIHIWFGNVGPTLSRAVSSNAT
jgi:hypothetical protein